MGSKDNSNKKAVLFVHQKRPYFKELLINQYVTSTNQNFRIYVAEYACHSYLIITVPETEALTNNEVIMKYLVNCRISKCTY